MMRSMAAGAAAALVAGAALAKGGGGYTYIYIPSVAPSPPGNACIADGVGSGQETKTSDGTLVLATGVHGADTGRCPNPAFPNLATTQKLPSDEVRNVPSLQCVPPATKVGDEVTIANYGRATVLELQPKNNACTAVNVVAASVISSVAHRASRASQSPQAQGAQLQAAHAPTDAEVRQEYDRLLAAAAPQQEYHVRHIMVHTREGAQAVIQRIKAGSSFADVAADISADPGSRAKGGDLGWNLPSSFVAEFSKTMVGLAPAGLATEPTQTRFGWHVIELLETRTGKDWFPAFPLVKDRIAARLKEAQGKMTRVPAKAVCRKMVPPQPAAEVSQTRGTVVVEMWVENGKVTKILNLSGPSVYHPAVTEAVSRYECDRLDRAVIVTQSFDF